VPEIRKFLTELPAKIGFSFRHYLAECLAWNAPNWCFEHHTWEDRVQSVLRFLWQNTKDHSLCAKWCEVDAVKYLFHSSQPWTRDQAHAFINAVWDYVGVRPV